MRVFGKASVLALTLVLGCNTAEDPKEEGHLRASALSDAQVFEGLFLATGPGAALVPVIREKLSMDRYIAAPQEKDAVRRGYDLLLSAIREVDPSFLPRFKTQALSGDRPTISKALDDAAAVTRQAIDKLPHRYLIAAAMDRFDPSTPLPQTPADLADSPVAKDGIATMADSLPLAGVCKPGELGCPSSSGFVALAVVAYVFAAVQTYVAVTTVGYAAIIGQVKIGGAPWTSTLTKEIIVDEIANEVGPPLAAQS